MGSRLIGSYNAGDEAPFCLGWGTGITFANACDVYFDGDDPRDGGVYTIVARDIDWEAAKIKCDHAQNSVEG